MASLPELPYKRKNNEVRLSKLVDALMKGVVEPKKNKLDPIVEVWYACVPPELAAHCRINGLNGNQLQVSVDTPAYLYQLQLCSKELIDELKCQCPRAGVQTIKFKLG